MEPKKFVEEVFESCQKAQIPEFEIRYSRSSSDKIEVEDGKVSVRTDNESQGVVLSVKIGKNIGGFRCEELSSDNVNLIVGEAVSNAELIDIDDENFFHDGSGDYPQVNRYQLIKDLYNNLDKEAFLFQVEKAAYALDKRVKKVISLRLSSYQGKSIVKNSLGLDLNEDYEGAYASLYLSAEENGIIKTGSEVVSFDKKEDFNPQTLARKAVEKAVLKLNAINVKSGQYQVVFENETFADFLKIIAGIFSANLVQEKRSKLVGKLGQKVASDKVFLMDNPLLSGGYGSRSFDDEGCPAQANVIIKDGILKTYLHNLRTAHKDGVKTTGNGSGGRGVSFSNFYLEPGSISKEELLEKVGNGVYVDALHGVHAGYNSVSGDFSFGAAGFLIEQGKIAQALHQFTISGNVYRLLEEIELIGNDLDFENEGFGAPCVAIKKLAISSE